MWDILETAYPERSRDWPDDTAATGSGKRRNKVPIPEQKLFCEDKAEVVPGLLLAQKGVFLLTARAADPLVD
jgi:hypothetical protein